MLKGLEINLRSYAAAEKGDEGMALKILTRAEDMADGNDSLESFTHTKWKRAYYGDRFQFEEKMIQLPFIIE